MPPSVGRHPSKVVRIALGISVLLAIFLIENLWIDARLHRNHHRIPSLVPEAQTTSWFLVFALLLAGSLLLVLCFSLLLKDRNASRVAKIGIGVVVAALIAMSVDWFRVTNGQSAILPRFEPRTSHKVVLTWKASPSRVAGYNVYRKTRDSVGYQRLNAAPLEGLTYTDDTVESGKTYSYVARSVDSHGDESADSETFSVEVP